MPVTPIALRPRNEMSGQRLSVLSRRFRVLYTFSAAMKEAEG